MKPNASSSTYNSKLIPPKAFLTETERKKSTKAFYDRLASEREMWTEKNRYHYEEDLRYFRFLIPENSRILQIGCGTGDLLQNLNPSEGVGVDLSEAMVKIAQEKHPQLQFFCGDIEDPALESSIEGHFDIILISNTIGNLEDVQATLTRLHAFCTPETRIVVAYYSWIWRPVLKFAEKINQHIPRPVELNWLGTEEIEGLLSLANFETVKKEWRQLIPKKMFGLGALINRFIAPIPMIRRLCLRNYIVARPAPVQQSQELSTTVLIPCRNEKGNIETAIKRLPRFCKDIEVIYVEGHSQDGTYEECLRVQEIYPNWDIKVFRQEGRGKGDAVRKGFDEARGDVLMILDADLTVPPEDLPKFYQAISENRGEFINGSRLVYPMERQAMRFLNFIANSMFSILFTWLLNQRFTDTLCGTKVISRKQYQKIAQNRSYFGDFDPFGDFDLIFGAAKLNMKIVEVPIRYRAREYGSTQISRFRHGWLLIKMVVFAFRKLKAF
ncbi:glycosyltransferase [Magnetococcales bacterium HHB-1]